MTSKKNTRKSERAAPEEQQPHGEMVAPGIFRWSRYAPEMKVELTSHAVVFRRHVFIFDPIALAEEQCRQLASLGRPVAIILTNNNHERATAEMRRRFQLPVWASPFADLDLPRVERFPAAASHWHQWRCQLVDGGSRGEIVLELAARRLLVFGDAFTNLDGYGLMLLPEKYARHLPTLRHSLKRVVARPCETALFAHGRPILEGAGTALNRCLEGMR